MEKNNKKIDWNLPPQKQVKMTRFNEDSFDVKVAKSIIASHFSDESYKKENIKFSNWVDNNYKHLETMYSLSNLSSPFETFITYIYDHSK